MYSVNLGHHMNTIWSNTTDRVSLDVSKTCYSHMNVKRNYMHHSSHVSVYVLRLQRVGHLLVSYSLIAIRTVEVNDGKIFGLVYYLYFRLSSNYMLSVILTVHDCKL